MNKKKRIFNKSFSILLMLIFIFTPVRVNGAEHLQTEDNSKNENVFITATPSDAKEKTASTSDIEEIPDLIIKIDKEEENSEDEITPRSRAEVISMYNIVTCSRHPTKNHPLDHFL